MSVRQCFAIGLACLIVILLALPIPAAAQDALHLEIDRVDFSRFPRVDILVTIRDNLGLPIQEGVFEEHFSLREDGEIVPDIKVTPTYEQPLDLVIVMDSSATTGYGAKPTPLQSAGIAARNLVNILGEQDRTAVVAFGNDVEIVQTLTSNKHPVNASLLLLEPAGNSALNDAILAALNLLKGSKRPLILLFTDGPDSGRSQLTTFQVAQAAYHQNVPVFVIGWRGANTGELQNMAALTGGSLQFIKSNSPESEEFQAAINNLLDVLKVLRGQYHLFFDSSLAADDQDHLLQIEIINQGRRQQADTWITALSQQVMISIPELQEGDTVSGIILINPKISASAPLSNVELLVDSKQVTILNPIEPETAYDTALLTPGKHRLTIIGRDTSGNIGQHEITIDVLPPVTVTLRSPPEGSVLRGEISIVAEVNAIPEISHVEFWVDDQRLGTRESGPYEITWDSSILAQGLHLVRVVAYDTQGHRAEAVNSVYIPAPNYIIPVAISLAFVLGVAALIIVPLRLRRKQIQHDQALSELFARKPACLRELDGINPGRVWSLDKDEFRLGRKPDENDLPLKGLSSARQQAIIRYLEGDYVIISLFPEKPALVNEIPALPQAMLKSGDTLRLGETVLHFEMQG